MVRTLSFSSSYSHPTAKFQKLISFSSQKRNAAVSVAQTEFSPYHQQRCPSCYSYNFCVLRKKKHIHLLAEISAIIECNFSSTLNYKTNKRNGNADAHAFGNRAAWHHSVWFDFECMIWILSVYTSLLIGKPVCYTNTHTYFIQPIACRFACGPIEFAGRRWTPHEHPNNLTAFRSLSISSISLRNRAALSSHLHTARRHREFIATSDAAAGSLWLKPCCCATPVFSRSAEFRPWYT